MYRIRDTELKSVIPVMFDNSRGSKLLIEHSGTVKASIEGFSFSNFVLNLLQKIPLNLLFGACQFVQMYVYFMSVNIEHPANSHHTGRLVASVINLEILPGLSTDHMYGNFEEEE